MSDTTVAEYCDECQQPSVVVTPVPHSPGMLNFFCRNCGEEWLDYDENDE